MNNNDCAVCKLIRNYLLFAVPLLAILGSSSISGEANSHLWFARVELIDILAYGALAGLISVIGYKAYEEYWLPRKQEQALKRLRTETTKGAND